MKVVSAEFITSIGKIAGYKDYGMPEITFVGRSNVGKSSLINALTNNKKLAKTSSSAGRTRLVNLFLINQRFILVDLPGYGYAKAGKEAQKEWKKLIDGYLESSNQLKIIFVLVDIRIKPSELDKQMLNYLYFYNMSFKVLATKADKLPKSQIKPSLHKIAVELGLGDDDIMPVSAESKLGLQEVLDFIDTTIEYEKLKPNTSLISTLQLNKKATKSNFNTKKQKVMNTTKGTATKIKTQANNTKGAQKVSTKTKHTPRYALKNRKGKK